MKIFEIKFYNETFIITNVEDEQIKIFEKVIRLAHRIDIIIYPTIDLEKDVNVQEYECDDPIITAGNPDEFGAYIYMREGVIYKENVIYGEKVYIKPFWEHLYKLSDGDYVLERQGTMHNYLLIEGTDATVVTPWVYRKYCQAKRLEII